MAHSRVWILALSLMAIGLPAGQAQLGPLSDPKQAPQAQTQEEFDAYLDIITEPDPKLVLRHVAEFMRVFPDSQFAGVARQYEMHAYQQTGDFDRMLAAGEKALAANPDNLNTLLTLAPAAANAALQRSDSAELLKHAQAWANSALAALDKTKVPRQWSLAKWNAEKMRMQAEAHETLGVVALDQKDVSVAVREFQTAVDLQPVPEGAQFLRLGLALRAQGDANGAVRSMQRAANLGPESVRAIALSQIESIAQSGTRRK